MRRLLGKASASFDTCISRLEMACASLHSYLIRFLFVVTWEHSETADLVAFPGWSRFSGLSCFTSAPQKQRRDGTVVQRSGGAVIGEVFRVSATFPPWEAM